MRFKTGFICVAASLFTFCFVTSVRAEDKPTAAGPTEAQMAEMMKLTTIGEQHAGLKRFVGYYTAEVTMSMGPNGPEDKSTGEEHASMIFGDRFLKARFTGKAMGQPFMGCSFVGYDNGKKKFTQVWMDDMNTGMQISEGTVDASGNVYTFTGECPCAANGGKMTPYRQVITFIDNDHNTMEMFTRGPDGKEFRGLFIKYTRAEDPKAKAAGASSK